MDVGQYRHVLAIRDTRNALALGLLIRIPMFAGTVLLTLHVVTALGRSYGQAGLVTAAATVAIAISGPWRGRLLDRLGLRRTVAPSLLIQLVCWSIAPWVDYAPLMALAALAGLFVVPTFSILRQVIIRSVPGAASGAPRSPSTRPPPSCPSWLGPRSASGSPRPGTPAGPSSPSRWPRSLAGCVLWVANPAIKGAADGSDPSPRAAAWSPSPVPGAWRGFITMRVAAVYLAAACATLVLSGTDVAIVAALRSFEATSSIGWILALWGAGSLVGGLVYGAWHRSFSVFWLLGGLAATTAPVALAVGVPSFAVLITLSGVLCAPTLTATVEQLSRVVPERFRGEMMGWHGSAMTSGSAVGAPAGRLRHRPRRLALGLPRRLGDRPAHRGGRHARRGQATAPTRTHLRPCPTGPSPVGLRALPDSESGAPAARVEH